MASNALAYSRFSAQPANIAAFAGSTVEELQTGRPDPNPLLSPMPARRVPDARLALSNLGSDRQRMNEPVIAANPYEGFRPAYLEVISALDKLGGQVMVDIQEIIEAFPNTDKRDRMSGSMLRLPPFRELLAWLSTMAQQTQAKRASVAAG